MSTYRTIFDDAEFEVIVYEQSSKIDLEIIYCEETVASVRIGDAHALRAMGEKMIAIASDWGAWRADIQAAIAESDTKENEP